jgi:PadR family transcriptional regulator, regulatory protein PadR
MIESGIKRGAAELAVLSVLENGARHGYEIARRIEQETNGSLHFTLAALYPMLYRMEKQHWIRGTWETSPNGRRRRCYRLTPTGKKMLSPLRKQWSELFVALNRLAGVSNP